VFKELGNYCRGKEAKEDPNKDINIEEARFNYK
jgi:hypothetical protein